MVQPQCNSCPEKLFKPSAGLPGHGYCECGSIERRSQFFNGQMLCWKGKDRPGPMPLPAA